MKKNILHFFVVVLAVVFVGCGKGTVKSLTKGYLIDSPVVGVEFECGDIVGKTKSGGEFECEETPVTFKIGNYTLGVLSEFTTDGNVYLQDLLGLSRTDFTDTRLIELSILLQSLDEDGDIDDEIIIPSYIADRFGRDAENATLEELAVMAGVTLVSQSSAIAHLYNIDFSDDLGSSSAGSENSVGSGDANSNSSDSTTTTNHVPVANAQSVTADKNRAKSIRLSATDSDGDTLTYIVVSNPSHGTLSGTAPNLTYTPTTNYGGGDSFTFKVNDGVLDSVITTVSITVSDTNNAPTATAQSKTVVEDSIDNAITLAGADADGDTLTYTIVSSPTHGTLSGTGSSKKYTPTANFYGSDSFTFKVSDGTLSSAVATVSITVTNLNDAPVISRAKLQISFKDHNITNMDSNFTQAFTIDLDDDSDMDIVTASKNDSRIAWYQNSGSEVFTEHNISTSANGAFSVYAIDVDGDSIKDVLSASKDDKRIVWYKNSGSEVFTEHNISKKSDGASSIFAMNIDGDSGIDILSADSGDNNITWYENDGNQNFTKHPVVKNFNGAVYATAFDFNKDGDIDILATATKDDDKNRTAWYENDGSENFIEHNISDTINSRVRAIYAVNLDNDADNDILVASKKRVVVYENSGTNTTPDFTEHNLTLPSYAPSINVMTKDIDGDGDLDIFSSGVWFENSGTVANPKWKKRHTLEKYIVAHFSMVDLDGDNDIDIVAPLYNKGALKWYENMGKNALYVDEGEKNITTVLATDVDGDTLTYGISGADVSQFDINTATGLLAFKVAPDYEDPKDTDKDNNYELTLSVNDGNTTTTLAVKVIVDDVDGH